jgi:hypothetical protein
MKKVVRMLGLCALVALAFTSCKKEDTKNTVTFKASITQPVSDSRTQLNTANDLVWLEGDAIRVFDATGNTIDPFVVETGKFTGTEAQFVGDGAFLANIGTPGSYTAFYPVANYDATTVTMNIPATQTYVAAQNGRFEDELYPMHATNNDEPNFAFTSDAGVLRVSLYGPATYTFKVKRIEIEAPAGEVLTGDMVYDNVTRAYSVVAPTTDPNKVVLECGNVSLNDELPREFDIVLLSGTLANGFTLTVVDENDNVFTRTTVNNNEVLAGHIRAMTSYTVTDF